MEDERRPVRSQLPPEQPEPEVDEPDDEVVPDGNYEPL
jgi:hypothetical protein